MNNNMILFDKPPQEVDSIGFALDAHQVNAHSCGHNRSRSDAHSMRIKVPMCKSLKETESFIVSLAPIHTLPTVASDNYSCMCVCVCVCGVCVCLCVC